MLKKRLELKAELGNINGEQGSVMLQMDEIKDKLKKVTVDNKKAAKIHAECRDRELTMRHGGQGDWQRLGGWEG